MAPAYPFARGTGMVRIKGKAKANLGGYLISPGAVLTVPRHIADAAVERGYADLAEDGRQTNVDQAGRQTNLEPPAQTGWALTPWLFRKT